MGCTLGAMFLGLSILAAQGARRAVRRAARRPSSPQVGKLVFGGGRAGQRALLRAAGRHDAHPRARRQHVLRRLPAPRVVPRRRQLHAQAAHQARAPAGVLERDHRPRRSPAIVLVIVTERQGRPPDPALRDRRVHRRSRCRRPAWPSTTSRCKEPRLAQRAVRQRDRRGAVVRSSPSSSRITKFTHGAWIDHRARPDPGGAARPAEPPVRGRGARARATMRRGRVQRSRSCAATSCSCSSPASTRRTARAIQYARTLMPDEMRAVHFAVDRHAAERARRRVAAPRPLARAARARRLPRPAGRPGGARGRGRARPATARPRSGAAAAPPLQAVLAPAPARQHRRRDRAACQPAPARQRDDGAVPPRRPRCRALDDPVSVEQGRGDPEPTGAEPRSTRRRPTGPIPAGPTAGPPEEPIIPIGEVRWRTHARIEGRIRSMRVQPWANVATLECVVVDDTGGLLLVFLGRRRVAGVELGRCVDRRGHGRQPARLPRDAQPGDPTPGLTRRPGVTAAPRRDWTPLSAPS